MTDTRHILYVTEFFAPDLCATAVVAADHLAQLAALRPDWQFTVLTGNRAWHDPTIVHPPRERIGCVDVIRVARPSLGSRSLLDRARGFAAFYLRALAAARDLRRVDLVIGSTAPPLGGRIARKIAERRGCPFIYKVYDLYPDTAVALGRLGEHSLVARAWRRDDTRTMREAAAVVCIARGMEDRLRRTRRLDSPKLLTIHDGYDAARIACGPMTPSHAQPPTGESAPAHRPLIVQYAGNMGLSHPFGTILDAVKRLAADSRIRFQFIGAGPARGELAGDLPPNAELLPFQPDDRFAHLLNESDVCLVTQHTDLFDHALPYKVYAILAAGKPLVFVGNPQSEIADWLRTADCGIAVPQGDGATLADAIASLKPDASRRAEMGRRARALFEERFHVTAAAGKWAALLDGVLNEHQSPGKA
ncbi:putative glycosyl transferase [Phycisphaerae bacterium RAS2]|nr:putative glycosyl transferase [Phycisphaerae bacterium RAS2]